MFMFGNTHRECLWGWEKLGSNLKGTGIDILVLATTSRLFGYV